MPSALPKLRERVAEDLALDGMPKDKALATAVRLMDRGFFRIGSEDYAEENDTYGIATMGKRHVTVSDDEITFDYEAKGHQRRIQAIGDPVVAEVVHALKKRRGGGEELLAYKANGRWSDVRSPDINEYVKAAAGAEFSAKDFRTWGGTVLAAQALAVSAVIAAEGTKSARKRAKTRAIKEVAHYLGNTPAVARTSYIDPRIFDRFDGGLTIAGVLTSLADEGDEQADTQRIVEEGVLDLLARDRDSSAVEKADELAEGTRGRGGLAAGAELGRVGRGRAADGHGGAVGHADADLAERGVEDVRAVSRAVHPGLGDHLRGSPSARAPGQVLAHGPAARAAQIARPPDPVDERPAVERVVREVVAGIHVPGVGRGRRRQAPVEPERSQPVTTALGVDRAQRGPHDCALARLTGGGAGGLAGRSGHGGRGHRNDAERREGEQQN